VRVQVNYTNPTYYEIIEIEDPSKIKQNFDDFIVYLKRKNVYISKKIENIKILNQDH